jgi:hypothetical protein
MVEVVYDGNLGNNLFQYCFGRILAERLGYRLSAKPIKGFPGTFDDIEGKDHSGKEMITLRGQQVDLSFLDKDDLQYHILLTGYFQRYEYYEKYNHAIKEWLRTEDDIKDEISENDVVIGIRRGKDYIPMYGLPISYYEEALSLLSYDRVFICTNEPNDPFIRYFQKKYAAIIRPPGGLDNLIFIKKFNKIIISNSTFLWWAAYLSEAKEIIFPRPANGFWSVHDPISKNIQLEVNEARYRYLECEKYKSEFISERLSGYYNKTVMKAKLVIKKIMPFLKRKELPKGEYFFREDINA